MVMRGRWASAAIGASIARNRAGAKMDEQAESYQREIDQLKAAQAQPSQVQQSSGQEDISWIYVHRERLVHRLM